MHKKLQFNKAERGQRGQHGGAVYKAAAISEVALTEGAFVQSRTKRNCSVLNKKKPRNRNKCPLEIMQAN